MIHRIAALGFACTLASASCAQTTVEGLSGKKEQPDLTLKTPAPLSTPPRTEPLTPKFGDKGTEWWTVGIGAADNFGDSTDFNVRGAWSRFIVQDVEFSLELNGWYFDQPGDNAFGINPAFVFRWHFVNTGAWTVFADAGIGMLFASEAVPEDGTDVDFTPRLGVGFTRALDDRGDRLQVGLRWHHISNARITGDMRNPSRDALLLYVGIEFPF